MPESKLLSVLGSKAVGKVREEAQRILKSSEGGSTATPLKFAVGETIGNIRKTFGCVIERNKIDCCEKWRRCPDDQRFCAR